MIKRNYITILLIVTAIVFPQVCVSAQKPEEVYTEFRGGNLNHSGDGTQESPYNLFEDAISAVAEGGTIHIMDKGAFINDIDGVSPFAITKNVTITGTNTSVRPHLSVRTAGMVLGADAVFKDIILSFSSGYRPIVCANGYSLVMDNVSYAQMTRKIHLSGGGMSDLNGTSMSPAEGERSRITVRGKDSCFGNIYAGSINDSFDRDVDIKLEDVSSKNIGVLYACGAEEGYYNGSNFLDPDNEPEDPLAVPNGYPVSGTVNAELINTGIAAVYGESGGGKNASVSVSTEFLASCSLINIGALCVEKGLFQPDIINDGADIYVQEGGMLDLSSIYTYNANNFSGGGVLILSSGGCLTISGECTGTTELRTAGGTFTSGIAEYEHLYIVSSGDGVFTFNPHSMQKDMKLERCDEGWKTSVQTEFPETVLTDFNIDKELMVVTASQINGEIPPEVCVNPQFADDTQFEDIGMLPLEYTVTYNGEKFSVQSDETTEYEGYYEGNIDELNMNFRPIEDTIAISNFFETGVKGDISAGVYDIEVTAPTLSGNITRSFRLSVIDDSDMTIDTEQMFNVKNENGMLDVIFINLCGKDIDSAVMNAGIYKNGALQALASGGESPSGIKNGEARHFSFDVSGKEYDSIKLFIWDSLTQMLPICGNHTI